MYDCLGYDCDGNEIYEYRILRAILSNDIDIEELDADPRQYCALIADNGDAYAISVYDWWNEELIRQRENIADYEEIPVIIKLISEMENYEVAMYNGGEEFYYDLERIKLKHQLNSILNNKQKKLISR